MAKWERIVLAIGLVALTSCAARRAPSDVGTAAAEGTADALAATADVVARLGPIVEAIRAHRREQADWPASPSELHGTAASSGEPAAFDHLESLQLLPAGGSRLVVLFELLPYEAEVQASRDPVLVEEAAGVIAMTPPDGGGEPETQIALTRLRARAGNGRIAIDLDADTLDEVVRQNPGALRAGP